MGLFAELKRRNVIRMAGLYLVGAWLVTQVAGTLLPMRQGILDRITARATEDRWPPTPQRIVHDVRQAVRAGQPPACAGGGVKG